MNRSEHLALRPDSPDLPAPPEPIGAYSAVVIRGNLGFVSGQFPLSEGVMVRRVDTSEAEDIERLRDAARLAARNVAAQIRKALGSWNDFAGLCRVDGIVAAPGSFTDHAKVLDAASETFIELFGPAYGAHARSAISSHKLPGDAAIELVVTFAVNSAEPSISQGRRQRGRQATHPAPSFGKA